MDKASSSGKIMADDLRVLTATKKRNIKKVKSFVERAASSISQLNLFVTVPTTFMPTGLSTANHTTGQQRHHQQQQQHQQHQQQQQQHQQQQHQQQQQDKRDPCFDHSDLTSGGSSKAYYWYQMNGNERTSSLETTTTTPKRKNTQKTKNSGITSSRKTMPTKAKEKQNNNSISREGQDLSNIQNEAKKTSLVELLRALPTVKKVSQISPAIIPDQTVQQTQKRNTTVINNNTNNKNNDMDLKQVKTPHKVIVAFMPRVIEVRPRDSDSEDDEDFDSIMSEITKEEGQIQQIRTFSDIDDNDDERYADSECSGDSNRIDDHCLRRNNIKIDGLFIR